MTASDIYDQFLKTIYSALYNYIVIEAHVMSTRTTVCVCVCVERSGRWSRCPLSSCMSSQGARWHASVSASDGDIERISSMART